MPTSLLDPEVQDVFHHLRTTPGALTTKVNWVVPTGGGYFFAPSIDALTNSLSKYLLSEASILRRGGEEVCRRCVLGVNLHRIFHEKETRNV